jgi:DNA replication protein DnaC
VYKKLERYDLIVLDDFGAERRTDYTSEIRYNVIDTRYNSGKPLILTTNITSFENKDIADSRVNSRIREKVLGMKFDGEDRRKAKQLDEAEIERLLAEGGWEDL